VDTYVQPSMSNSATRLAKSLGLVQQTAGALGQVAAIQNQQAEREGHEAFLRGDETPEQVEGVKKWFTAQNVKRESFMALKGQSDVVKLTPKLEEIVANTSDPLEAKAQLEQLRKNHIDGSGGSIGYLSKFSPAYDAKVARAMTQVEAKARVEGRKIWQDQQSTLIGNQLDGVFASQMPVEGMTREQLLRDPEAYNEFTAGFNSADTAKLLRQTLSDIQDNAKAIGISDRSEVSKFFVKEITRYAKDYGLPELLDFADIEHNGIKLSKVMHQDILDAKASATATQDRLEVQAEKKQIKYRKEVTEDVNRKAIGLIQELQLAQQDNTSEGVNKRADVEAKLDAFLEDPQLVELRGWDPKRVEWILGAQQRAKDPFETPSLDVINEGYRLWASGKLTADWYLGNMESLGTHKNTFASKANSVVSKEEAADLELTYDLGQKNFATAMRGPVNELSTYADIDGAQVPDYAELHSIAILRELKKLSTDPNRTLNADAVGEIYTKVNSDMMERITKDLQRTKSQTENRRKLAEEQSKKKASWLNTIFRGDAEELEESSDKSVDPDLADEPEKATDADEPKGEPEIPKATRLSEWRTLGVTVEERREDEVQKELSSLKTFIENEKELDNLRSFIGRQVNLENEKELENLQYFIENEKELDNLRSFIGNEKELDSLRSFIENEKELDNLRSFIQEEVNLENDKELEKLRYFIENEKELEDLSHFIENEKELKSLAKFIEDEKSLNDLAYFIENEKELANLEAFIREQINGEEYKELQKLKQLMLSKEEGDALLKEASFK